MFKRRNRKQTTAEVNVIPFIDLLSVCISFLLLTAVWLQTGVMTTKQALGTESSVENQKTISLWVEIGSENTVFVSTQASGKSSAKKKIDISNLKNYAEKLKQRNPGLKTALLFPHSSSNYNEMIRAMDSLRKAEISDIGISPL